MLAVTGLIHSGTSPLARIAHQSGIIMGIEMEFPVGGEPEWEDADMSAMLTNHALFGINRDNMLEHFVEYIERRQQHFAGLQRAYEPEYVQAWGVKSPLLAIYRSIWERAAEKCGESVVWVASSRPNGDVAESLLRNRRRTQNATFCELVGNAGRLNRMIEGAVAIIDPLYQPTLEEIQTRPRMVAESLRALLDLPGLPPDVERGIWAA